MSETTRANLVFYIKVAYYCALSLLYGWFAVRLGISVLLGEGTGLGEKGVLMVALLVTGLDLCAVSIQALRRAESERFRSRRNV